MSPMTGPSSQASAGQDSRLLKSTFLVSNIHCSSCVAYINEVLSDLGGVKQIDVSVLTHEVRVVHHDDTDPSHLATALVEAAFDVHHVTTYEPRGSVISELDTTSWLPRDSVLFTTQPNSSSKPASGSRHVENCDACRKEELDRLAAGDDLADGASRLPQDRYSGLRTDGKPSPSESEFRSLVRQGSIMSGTSVGSRSEAEGKFNARVSIGGMSCASCANSITNEVKQLDFVEDIIVNLLTNSAAVVFTGPQSNIEKVVEQIEDIGFEASLDEVNKVKVHSQRKEASSSTFVADISIGGMTCGSCSGAVTRGLEELSFVTEVSVNLLTHSGRVEFEGREHIDDIVEKIEDLGYDASVNSVVPLILDRDEAAVEERTVSIHVDGMFCHHCPEKVIQALTGLPDVKVDGSLSVKNPILAVTYTPKPPALTVRKILQTIDTAHDLFTATVYRPPSIEDRSRAMQRHERRRLLTRFLFVLVVAIPTFLLGIVFMSLVPSRNKVRKFLEEPMWAGDASRLEWALFIMTTPVMFYGADIFHVRAMKEIYSLWRPGSRAPVLRRFYRFGSMNLLISAGTTVAYVSSLAVLIMDAAMESTSSTHSSTYFDTVVFLTMFILAGRFMEAYSKAKTGDAVASLGKLRPTEALLRVNASDADESGDCDRLAEDGYERINIDLLEVGDVVSIPHGASPPADGVVVGTGSYRFDESSLTGESRPVSKSAGDQVFTGSVNVGQPVEVKVSAIGGSSMLDQIISVVREGQSRRAPLERVADLLTSHFVPIITLIAILTFVIWLALGHSGTLPYDYLDVSRGGWTFWSLEFAIAVFVVACPCGLALAAPTALFVGGGLAARQGILVKGGGEAFQEASRLDAIVFDKTGTLTEGGSLQVSDHEAITTDARMMQVAWTLARKLEESSNHPIARAITTFCREKPSVTVSSSDIEEISGQGMKGVFTLSVGDPSEKSDPAVHYEAAIGNQHLLQSLATDDDDGHLSKVLSKYQAAGKSTAILALRRVDSNATNNPSFSTAVVFAISDSIRPDAAEVISKLQKRKVNVFMCTGDNQTTAYAVADMVGIPHANVMANVMPGGKADFVRQVQDGNFTPRTDSEAESQRTENGPRSIVAFVGDGVNDSPALAAADVSIAMASGSDVAMNSASFILLNSELDTILQLVLLSRRVFNRVKLNFGWALVYNCCLVPVAAGVFYPIVSGHKHEMVGDAIVTVNTHWRLSPVWAALAMALSSISVVCSSLALGLDKRTINKLFRLPE
ncbi:putative copper resistance-associated P-type ATPase [Aspergillus ibericus CBS 121593]|uniref:Putative copper resistance-associated P-type ATPase n=1 Tax=Aspergillus ibericus CBS 121593 TaxID=1448316 RepID=A0A395GRZ0_9EURO|nr:putative copper resistance-associated P-type ATPase [Aspergillus ibericus CBS 121593]RAK98295.1 putative copper resistance-associated P-type ATPase [Aspergillus ibericus CBS 121593]